VIGGDGGGLGSLLLLVAAGLVAGYVNSVAGAGSLLTLPALIFTGLDPVSANATNRVAVLFQNAAALTAVRRQGRRLPRAAWVLAAPAVVGGAIGAALAGRASQDAIRISIAVAMPVFLVLSLWRPRARRAEALRVRPGLVVAFFLFGIYAGYLQAGIGVLILLVLGAGYGIDLVEANAAKLLAVFLLTVAALGTFVLGDVAIDPVRGGALALATTVGGYLGGAASVRRGAGFIRAVLVVTVAATTGKLLWDALR